MKLLGTVFVLIALAAIACGGDDDGGDDGGAAQAVDIFFAPESADEVAHAGLPALADLPGDGWQVVATDDFGDNENAVDFLQFIQGQEACQTLNNLATLEDLFGGDEASDAAGKAQIEFERSSEAPLSVPTSIEVEIEIDETVAELQGNWTLVKELFESEQTSECFLALFNSMFEEQLGGSGFEIEVTSVDGSAEPPHNGATLAFQINMSIAGIDLDMMMQMYFWPYGNAGVQAFFLGPSDALNADLVAGTLQAIDRGLTTANED